MDMERKRTALKHRDEKKHLEYNEGKEIKKNDFFKKQSK